MAHLARVSPDTRPDLFPTPEDRLAYWINAYNGLVLTLALDHYPIPSLRTLDNPAGLTPGLVFLARRFNLGGRWWSLHAIESRIRSFRDARYHFILNCAARSCPPLARHALSADSLDLELDAATRRFLADPRNFRIDSSRGSVMLSPLFSWHAFEFRRDLPRDLPLPRRVGSRALLSWVEPYLDDARRAVLHSSPGWTVTFSSWDWSLNVGRKNPGPAASDSFSAP